MKPLDYWNEAAATKEFTTPFQLDLFAGLVSREALVLDLGCGYGRILNDLHSAGYRRLIGQDFSPDMIARGRRLFPHLELAVSPEDGLGLADGSVDAVILAAVLTCIISDEEQAALLDRIRRVLKPGGILYINDFLLNTDGRNLERYARDEAKFGCYGVFELPEGAAVRHHEAGRLRTELLAPFEELRFERVVYTTMNGNQSNGFYYLGRRPAV